ncbi:MAG TPA: tetratricopeptide repeat protein, partial [Bacteroidia bacterium]|nr:tetratricopeptide repeat protein [Bacteroidia bacterium]
MQKYVKNLSLSLILLITCSLNAQTKAEKTAKSNFGSMDMYNSTQNKEALEFFNKGEVASQARDYKNCLKWYKKAIDKDDKFVEAYDNLGVAYRNLGDFDNAKKCYATSLKLYPNGPMAHQNL